MINIDDKLAEEYLCESREHLAGLETDLLAMENGGSEVDQEVVNHAFRQVHSVKGGASLFDLVKIGELAQATEGVLATIRAGKTAPKPDRVGALLRATDKLQELIENPGTSNQADITENLAALAGPPGDSPLIAGKRSASSVNQSHSRGNSLRVLLVEDDFASRLLLQTFLSRYGECHMAVNGVEAVEAFRSALERGLGYDLICMDIMMPEMDGREAVRQVRALEEARGILSTHGAKIIMTTAVGDIKEVIRCFQDLCDAYLVKPVDLAKLLSHMKSYHLVP